MDAIFHNLIPFRFLSIAQQETLQASMELIEVPAGTRLIRGEETEDRSVFVLLEGTVQIIDSRTHNVLNQIEQGQYFGERAALFDLPRPYDAVARERVRCVAIGREAFLTTIENSPAFAIALGHILRVKQGLFREFEQFKAALLHAVETNTIQLTELSELYKQLGSALHHHVNSRDIIDFDALSYALARLPENITRTFMLFLTDNLPDIYSDPEQFFTSIPTAARRRTVYEMMPGKSMVLVRDGESDVIDLLTCLCLYKVEAQKIRRRFTDPVVYTRLLEAGKAQTSELDALPFSPIERKQIRRLWGKAAVQRLYEITLHHEDFGVEITKQLNTFNVRHSERWTLQIAEATHALLGDCDPRTLPDGLAIHIISSNTHSVANCLSPYFAEHAEAIHAWGKLHRPEICALPWDNPTDCLYAVARDYLAANPKARAKKQALEREAGILRLQETAFTGIEVALFDTSLLCGRTLDPMLPDIPENTRALIVNIDYAFGQQAEEILANLILLFGKRISSINVLGKAGALTGKRGDILLATSFVEHSSDLLHKLPTPPGGNIVLERLQATIPKTRLHQGAMLTVDGTLLQNSTMLNFYHHIHQAIGLEMEGAYYLRQLLKGHALELLDPELEQRFLYYVSDVPLDPESTLAGPLKLNEGVPPLYAITREVLTGIFVQESAAKAKTSGR